MLPELTYVTSNPNKIRELARCFHLPVTHGNIDLPEIQSLDIEEVITEKVKEAYRRFNKPVIVEDAGVVFSALGKLPGPLVKWFYDSLGLVGLCKMLDSYEDRSAIATTAVAFYDGKDLKIFQAHKEGIIARVPPTKKGWGTWSDIFICKGYNLTWAEMDEVQQEETSIRRVVYGKLESYLREKYMEDNDIVRRAGS